MPRQIRIIHARDFIRAKPDSPLDLDESKRLLLEVSRFVDGCECDPCEILLDTRDSRSALTGGDLLFLADALAASTCSRSCRSRRRSSG